MAAGRATEALLGRERARTISGFLGGVLIFGLILAVTVGLYQHVSGLWGARWWIALVVLPVVAGVYAYWNNGLIVSLWLSTTTAFAMYWGFNNATSLSSPLVLWGLLGTTLITAIPYGIVGYVGGRLLWRHKNRDVTERPPTKWLVDLLIGRNLNRTTWTLALAIGLFMAGFGLMLYIHEPGDVTALQSQLAIRDYFRLADLIHLRSEWRIVALLAWIGLPAAVVFWNDGYLLSWFLVFGAAYGVNVGQRFTQEPDIAQAIFDPLLQVLTHALILGTIGFALGAGLRRAVHRWRNRRIGHQAGAKKR